MQFLRVVGFLKEMRNVILLQVSDKVDIVGIATMHKSNAVPVMRGTNEAIEIAAMRR